MSDGPGKFAMQRSGNPMQPADALASRALSVVASRSAMTRGRLDPGFMHRLEAALLQPDRSARLAVLADMRTAGVPWAEVTDHYIPAIARRLGDLWCVDEVSFADVTIGVARLQSMLRDVASDWAAEIADNPLAPNVLLVVRSNEYHTLGAMVVASQLRRIGLSVRLMLGEEDGQVAALCGRKSFDAVLVSASSGETLESLRDLVNCIRRETKGRAPIVVGGTVLDTDRDVGSFTGADHVTSDAFEAVRLCGLRIPFLDAEPIGTGG